MTRYDGYTPFGAITLDSSGNLFGVTDEVGSAGANRGIIWEYTAGGTYRDIHDFGQTIVYADGATTGIDGGSPSPVTIDSYGNFYGTLGYGGLNGVGLLYELTASGQFEDLHDFNRSYSVPPHVGNPDGSQPSGQVVLAANGNLFGTTSFGGLYDNRAAGQQDSGGVVWEYSAQGVFSVLHQFGGTLQNSSGQVFPDGQQPTGLIQDQFGNLFGTTLQGGANSSYYNGLYSGGMLWEVTSVGTYLDLFDFEPSSANGTLGFSPSIPTMDANGNFYGTTEFGGFLNEGTVWKVNPQLSGAANSQALFTFGGTIISTANTDTSCAGYSEPVTLDRVGTVYGVALGGGLSNGNNDESGILFAYANSTRLASLSFNSNSVVGVGTATGTVALDFAAPVGGAVVQLSVVSGAATVPSQVEIYPGHRTAQFSVSTQSVSTETPIVVKASYGALTLQQSFEELPTNPTSITISPSPVIGGDAATGTVILKDAAPAGGLTVHLSSTGAVSVPTGITVPAGTNVGTFQVVTEPVAAQTFGTVEAKTPGGEDSTFIQINACPAPSSVSARVNPLVGGSSTVGTVTLASAAPHGGTIVHLAVTSGNLSIPTGVTVAAGSTTATFTISASVVASTQTATLLAKDPAGSVQTSVTIIGPAPALISFSPSVVIGGNSSIATVELNQGAPAGGLIVHLSASGGVSVPAGVTIPAGQTSAKFKVNCPAVQQSTASTILAKTASGSVTASITVEPLVLQSLQLTASTTIGGSSGLVGKITLNGPAPSVTAVSLTSSNPAIVSVPSSVTVNRGAATGLCSITTSRVTSDQKVSITAKFGSTTITVYLTVTP